MSTFGLEMKGIGKAEREEIALKQLKLVKLEKFAQSYPHHLSGGMQQRVAIARALAYNPAVLLMDEPFAALDALTRDDMQRLLADVWRETRKTVIYVTHNVAEAVYLADRVIVMSPHPGTVKTEVPIRSPGRATRSASNFLDYQKVLLRHLGQETRQTRTRRTGRDRSCRSTRPEQSGVVMEDMLRWELDRPALLLASRARRRSRSSARRRRAQSYPTRPIRLVVGFGAGGPTDIPARFIADKLGDDARAARDGREQAGRGRHARHPGRDLAQPRRRPHAPALHAFRIDQHRGLQECRSSSSTDLAPISLISKYYYGIAMTNALPANDSTEFVQYAKANPGEISYATIGAASAQEILVRQLERLAGISMNRIPFRTGPQIMPELIAGRVHIYVSPTLAVLQQYQSKELKMIAMSSPERLKGGGPDIPTLEREGHDFRALRLARHLRPRRHAAADRRLLNRHIAAIVASPEYRAMIEKAGSLPESSTPGRASAR